MNFKEMQKLETENFNAWFDSMRRNDSQWLILIRSCFLAFTPIGLHTLSGKTLLLTLGWDTALVCIGLPMVLAVYSLQIALNILTLNFGFAIHGVLNLIDQFMYLALELAVTAMSFVTRPIVTLAYLFKIAIDSLLHQDNVIEQTQALTTVKF